MQEGYLLRIVLFQLSCFHWCPQSPLTPGVGLSPYLVKVSHYMVSVNVLLLPPGLFPPAAAHLPLISSKLSCCTRHCVRELHALILALLHEDLHTHFTDEV